MKVSLVITTYNWWQALELSLASALDQTRVPEEIIIADDGSTDETRKLILRMSQSSNVPVVHSWQEDKGFRAAMSRNKAIAKAKGEYIIVIDGDIVLGRHFVEDHLANAAQGLFVQGGRVIFSEKRTDAVMASKRISFSVFSRGLGNRKNCLRSVLLSRLFTRTSKSIHGIRTCNFAFWRQDALAVNGFNEDFVGWGREDSEFAVRLLNNGLLRKNLKFMATAYHLYHPVCERDRLPKNDNLLDDAVKKKLTWCENGINKYF